MTRADLAHVYTYLGDLDAARELVRTAFDVAKERQPISLPWVTTAMALILLARELEDADAALDARPRAAARAVEDDRVGPSSLARAGLASARGEHVHAIEIADGAGPTAAAPDPLVAEHSCVAAPRLPQSAAPPVVRSLADACAEAEGVAHRRVLWEVLAELAEQAEARGDIDGGDLRTDRPTTRPGDRGQH
jgi:hypothetical protein